MASNGPHPLAIFSLVPDNERASTVLNHPDNAHRLSTFLDKKNKKMERGLDIGPHIRSESPHTLATIGRRGDIKVQGSCISSIHCSFVISEKNNREVMLCDRSDSMSTQFFGHTAVPFELGRPDRRVVVDEEINLEFGFGGIANDTYKFRIFWHGRSKNQLGTYLSYQQHNHHHTRAVFEEPTTAAPTRPMTRARVRANALNIRYLKRSRIGSGSFGEVWKVVNVDTGEHMAVKRIQIPGKTSSEYEVLQREVETLRRISHSHIMDFKSSQDRRNFLEIFMELKAGSVHDLISQGVFVNQPALAIQLVHQMLQALDYLAHNGIVHRDVKPANILYTPALNGYHFQLADFGLAHSVDSARTVCGSPLFMAPELELAPGAPQTCRVDVWSLFVTIAFTLNVDNFQTKILRTTHDKVEAVQRAAMTGLLEPLKDMANPDPNLRATAADILDKAFHGEGRTTPRWTPFSSISGSGWSGP